MASSDPNSSGQASLQFGQPNRHGSTGLSAVHHARKAVIAALIANLVVAIVKLVGAVTIARSAALFSEGLHSLGDCMNSVMLLIGLSQGNRAPDRSHPFGYGLETNFWALLASFLLMLGGGYAAQQGWYRLQNPEDIGNVWFAISILLISLFMEVWAIQKASHAVLEELGLEARGLGAFIMAFRNIKHVVAPTTRFVFYEDTIAFLGALVALIAIVMTETASQFGWMDPRFHHYPDAIAAMLIGGLLLTLAFNLLMHNRKFLLGSSASEQVEEQIQRLVLSIHGVSKVTRLNTTDHGLAGLIVHLSVEVEPETMVKDVDDLTEHIKEKLQARMPKIRQVIIEVLADESATTWSDKFLDLVEQGLKEGVLKPREEMMLRNLYAFTQAEVQDVMVPRTDVDLVEVDTPILEVIDRVITSGHSRLPVYRKNVDDIVGVIHSRDLFRLIQERSRRDAPITEIMREIDIYPENKPVSDLLEEFKRNKIQIAAVADEHGGFSGLVTLEDLMEQIVGDIWDESDDTDLMLTEESDTILLVSGKYYIEDLNERFDLNIPTDEFKTLGGYVFGMLGREPENGDSIPFEDLTLTVTEADGPRIKTIRIESQVPFETRHPEETSNGN
jgi:cation diffusion facilitator family transporter